ncbi:MAG: SHOCT domain-containing protein [Pseudomonadota bacterium]
MYGPYDYGWMHGGGMGMMMFGGFLMILVWVILLLLIFGLVKYLFIKPKEPGVPEHRPEGRTALDILNEAYARGEISRDEYLQKRADLLEK